jgi:tungstate transport system substrate-binding protein
MFRPRMLVILAALASTLLATTGYAEEKSIVVASTTSTEDSGLFRHILPLFKAKIHAKSAEEKFLADGAGVKRYPVMYNDFVLIGPKSDAAGISGGKDIVAALKAIKEKGAPFISRGDRSGTHIAELNLWKAAGIDIEKDHGPWYKSIGQGMGAALNTASASNAYVLSDRGTWLWFKNRGDLTISVEGDKRLFNQYGVILVNPAKHPHVKKELGQGFIDWLVSPEGQKAIADYKINGEQLFYPNADDPSA